MERGACDKKECAQHSFLSHVPLTLHKAVALAIDVPRFGRRRNQPIASRVAATITNKSDDGSQNENGITAQAVAVVEPHVEPETSGKFTLEIGGGGGADASLAAAVDDITKSMAKAAASGKSRRESPKAPMLRKRAKLALKLPTGSGAPKLSEPPA